MYLNSLDMKIFNNLHAKPDSQDIVNNGSKEKRHLILHNDEFNLIDFVIDTLINVCEHTDTQAEQCALITHYKGKCDIKSGTYESLKPMKDELVRRGLKATIN